MKTKAAILWGLDQDWSVEEVELDDPKEGEVMIKLAASGLCHSDEHLRTGDIPIPFPVIGGHEGAGVIEKVGPGVDDLAGAEPFIAAADCVEDPAELTTHVVVASVAAFGRNRDQAVLQNRFAVRFNCIFAFVEPIKKVGQLPHFHVRVHPEMFVGVLFIKPMPVLVAAALVA